MKSKFRKHLNMLLPAIALTGAISYGAKTNNIKLPADEPSEPVKQEQVMPTSKDSQDDVVISMPTMPPIENTVEQELEGPLNPPNPPTPECVDNRPENNNQLMQQYAGSIGNGYIVVYYHNNIAEDQLYNCAEEPIYIEKTIFIPDDSIDGVIRISADAYNSIKAPNFNQSGYLVVYEFNPISEDQPLYTEKTIFIPDDSINGVIKVSVDDYKKLQSTKTIKL